MDRLEVFGQGGEGSTAAYGFARAGSELLFGMATAGFSCVSKLGKGIFILDMLGNARAAGSGAADIHENGASVGNVIQTIGGALGLLGNASRLARPNGGCFVPGTLVQVSVVPSLTSAWTSVLCGETDALATWPSFCEATDNSLIPIEHVLLGSRVPSQNPRLEDYDFSLPEVEQATWRRIGLQVRRNDGAFVEMDLLRPAWWVEHYNMSVGRTIDLRVSELQLDGTAIVTSLAACCPVADGSGSVVTGRFVTREVSNLVELVLENGTTLTGTSTHPVWTINHQDWTPLAELLPGDLADTDTGPQPIASIRTLNHVSDVFNIEVHGHHVYRVTKDAILVHNACPDVPDAPDGVVYKRTDLNGGVEPYGGQAESLERYAQRQKEHARAHPDADFDFEIVDRAVPGEPLDIAEHNFIQELTGGVRAKYSQDVSNLKDPVGKARRPGLGLPEPRDPRK